MTKPTPKTIAVTGLFTVLIIAELVLAHQRSVLEKKNHLAVNQTLYFKTSYQRIERHLLKLFHSLQKRSQKSREQNSALAALKNESESLRSQLKISESGVNSIKEEKAYLEEMLINKTKQIEILNHQKAKALEEARQQVQAAEAAAPPQAPAGPTPSIPPTAKDEELKNLAEQNRILQEKLDRLYKATNANLSEINVAKIAFAETISAAKQKIDQEWNTVDLGSVTSNARSKPHAETATPDKKPVKAEGHVLAINSEHGFVVIDLGKTDNLPSDAMLEVKRNGRRIATINVLEIRDAMAACNIKNIQSGQKIEVNDPVSLLR